MSTAAETTFVSSVLQLLESEKNFPYIPEREVRAAVELIRESGLPDADCNPYFVMDELNRLIRIKEGYAA